MEDSIDTAALSRIYELKDDCDYIMMKSTIIKEFGQDVCGRDIRRESKNYHL